MQSNRIEGRDTIPINNEIIHQFYLDMSIKRELFVKENKKAT